jgi:hypothetical protein
MKKVIESINSLIQTMVCCDMEIIKYDNNKLLIGGGLSLSYSHTFIIEFDSVFMLSLNSQWTIDTSKKFIEVLSNEDSFSINQKWGIERGYYLFRILTEDNVIFHIAAKSIMFYQL